MFKIYSVGAYYTFQFYTYKVSSALKPEKASGKHCRKL